MGCAYSVPSKPAERCAAADQDGPELTAFDAELPRSAGATRSTRRRKTRAARAISAAIGGAVDTKRVGAAVRQSLQSSTATDVPRSSARGLAATPKRAAPAKPQRAGRSAHSVAQSTTSPQSTDLTTSAVLDSIEFDIADGPAAGHNANPLVNSGTLYGSCTSGASRRIAATPTPRRAASGSRATSCQTATGLSSSACVYDDGRPAAFSCVDSTGATVESRLQNRSQVNAVGAWVDGILREHSKVGYFDDPQQSARAPRPAITPM
jgi:hypothetical protein